MGERAQRRWTPVEGTLHEALQRPLATAGATE